MDLPSDTVERKFYQDVHMKYHQVPEIKFTSKPRSVDKLDSKLFRYLKT